jgi:membrane protease YdiL (CAAX protease family)
VTSTPDPKTAATWFWPLASFVALAYAISWAWAFPFVAVGDVIEKGVGWPTNFPALLGPALAALVVTALVWGRAGVRDLLARIARWRLPFRWWVATLSPLAFLAVALGVAAATGKLPGGSGFGRYSGFPAIGVVPVAVVAILITFGEEAGWRGFALPLLQRRYGALAAATSTIQAVTSAFVYVLAFLLVGLELRARRRGQASILGPRRGDAPPLKLSTVST